MYYEVLEPRFGWEEIGGLQKVKERLEEMVSLPLKYHNSFEKANLKPPAGILLWGPPGGGKSMLAEASAYEANASYITVKGIEVISEPHVIKEMFEEAVRLKPCVVFINEIDSLAPRREEMSLWTSGITRDAPMRFATPEATRIINQALDSVSNEREVVTIGATYRPDILDPVILRNGRLERKIYVPAPDFNDRLEILRMQTRKMPVDIEVDLGKLAKMTEYYVGADIVALCREAALIAIKEGKEKFEKIKMVHFLKAFERINPPLTKEELNKYEEVLGEECPHRYQY